jgi:predicted ABC-type exoprotein transport system permease subunit
MVIKMIRDRSYLIGTALIVLIAGVGLFYVLEDGLHLSKGWSFFVWLSIVYVLAVTKFSLPILRKVKGKIQGTILLIGLQLAFVSIMFLVLYSKLLALPEKGLLIWGVALGGVATITVNVFATLIKSLERRGKANSHRSE